MKLSLGRSQLLDSAFERATLYRNRLKRLIDVDDCRIQLVGLKAMVAIFTGDHATIGC